MDYILQHRQYVRHPPVLMVGAAILVLHERDRLLMMKRSDIGCWGLPDDNLEQFKRTTF